MDVETHGLSSSYEFDSSLCTWRIYCGDYHSLQTYLFSDLYVFGASLMSSMVMELLLLLEAKGLQQSGKEAALPNRETALPVQKTRVTKQALPPPTQLRSGEMLKISLVTAISVNESSVKVELSESAREGQQ
ncbi:hypothetical protein LWI29_002278 [Acer saccharum]|uniref:Uncharacterized protein n=1 Tax=Acer saccharum TaxID=4024 RepID=A0AA39RI56_ACESA|nr:hypothetical protein LWI29_002278 [Acer saccharum]